MLEKTMTRYYDRHKQQTQPGRKCRSNTWDT